MHQWKHIFLVSLKFSINNYHCTHTSLTKPVFWLGSSPDSYRVTGAETLLMFTWYRQTPPWRWTQTATQMRRARMRAGTDRTDTSLPPPLCAVPLSEPCLPPAPPLALGRARALAPLLWTLSLSRRLVWGPAPCPLPAPGSSHTMTGFMILLFVQSSASNQECRKTKVFTLLYFNILAMCSTTISLSVCWIHS